MFNLLNCANSSPFGLDPYPRGKRAVEMEHTHPTEIPIRAFDASHLLQLSTKRYFQINGKQPVSPRMTTITSRARTNLQEVVLSPGLSSGGEAFSANSLLDNAE